MASNIHKTTTNFQEYPMEVEEIFEATNKIQELCVSKILV